MPKKNQKINTNQIVQRSKKKPIKKQTSKSNSKAIFDRGQSSNKKKRDDLFFQSEFDAIQPLIKDSQEPEQFKFQSKSFRWRQKQGPDQKISNRANKNVSKSMIQKFLFNCFSSSRSNFFEQKFPNQKIKNSILKKISKQKKKHKQVRKHSYTFKCYEKLFKYDESNPKQKLKSKAMREFAYKSISEVLIPQLMRNPRVEHRKTYLYSYLFYQHRTLHPDLVLFKEILKPQSPQSSQ